MAKDFQSHPQLKSMRQEANSNNNGEGIVIDGYFGDWNDISKEFDQISSAESEHISLNQYAATESNEKYYMYLNVKGNILNGISVPSYSAKSIPDMKEGDFDNDYEPVGVSNQEVFHYLF